MRILLILLMLCSQAWGQEVVTKLDVVGQGIINEELRRTRSSTSANGASIVALQAELASKFPVTIANGGTGQTTAQGATNAILPSQTGNSGKYLTTNGSVSSWGDISIPVVKTLIFGAYVNGAASARQVSVTGFFDSTSGIKNRYSYFPISGTLRNLYTSSSSAEDIIVYKNGAATNLLTTNEGASLDSVHTVSVSAGDYITIQLGKNTTATWSIEFDPS